MKVLVLLSAGRHPASGRAGPVPVELAAVRLGASLGGADLAGLHAGPDADAVADALGHGLARLHLQPLAPDADPLGALEAAVRRLAPDLVLAGNRGQGGEDAGLLPYALAARLGRPIVADAVALASDGDGLVAEQALGRGARRRVELALPAVVTVHPSAPPPLPFAFGRRRSGTIERLPAFAADAPAPAAPFEERPYRKRPKLIAKAAAGASAADRLKAATEAASGGGRVLVAPDPAEAAAEILAHLRAIGVLKR
ncbi:adenine nucleotide alpha hydrolase family protein [Methylobrevis albus]|uniref:Electron transfer flavoprotein subunit beta n=1 Tax=Methylobrevis albus TaxID=2793297 RepID=A0A931HZ17_9HYPH|nr:electron transfer flavoprotein subunit beta [Methylobrevis albus]MBH0237377.1 electron transfer flavoprotein subunit beta [Methylobrevis albus]